MRTPAFWHNPESVFLAPLLAPLGRAYGLAGRLRHALVQPWTPPVPVICVGNAVAGGAGKTPVAISLGQRLVQHGRAVHFLTRGYGGSETGPLRVDPALHSPAAVGDEPLLLVRTAPTWIGRDRRKSCEAAARDGAHVLIMDDGFQNPAVVKTISLLVIDGRYRFGNDRLIPAGPLREPADTALARADAVVLLLPDATATEEWLARRKPLLKARMVAGPEQERLTGKSVIAFAGIGMPKKFFIMLWAIGCRLVATHAFADHYMFRPDDVAQLRRDAEAKNAILVTTEKDMVRLGPALGAGIETLTVSVAWQDEAALDAVLEKALAHGA